MPDADYKEILKSVPFGVSYNRIVNDDAGVPVDSIFLEVNRAFELLLDLKGSDVFLASLNEVLFGSGGNEDELKRIYQILAEEGGQSGFEFYALSLKKWIRIQLNASVDGHFSAVYTDITHQKESDTTIRYHLRMQELIINISSTYLNIDLKEIDCAIQNSLKDMCEFVGADRAYVFEYNFTSNTASNTFEWCAEGISSEMANFQDVPLDTMFHWVEKHRIRDLFYIHDVSSLPDEGPLGLRSMLEIQGIRSVMTLPMFLKNELLGFIGFDFVRRQHVYSENEKALLDVFAQMLVNIKERQNSDGQLKIAKEAAEAASRAKSEFLANMGHEIRTPMNSILGFSEALFDKLESPAMKKMAASIRNSGNHLLSLLNNILDLSYIESGKMDLSYLPTDVNLLIREVRMLFTEKAHDYSTEILFQEDDGFPSKLKVDEVRLKQVIFNLMGNAVKFTKNGVITISAKYVPDTRLSGELRIEIADTGVGIPADKQESVFEAFTQESGRLNRHYSGVGLGLTISLRLVEKMGGRVELESKEGHGSRFTVVLPGIESFSAQGNADISHAVSNNSIIFEHAEVMVVDDFQENIETINSFLFNSNVTVIPALSAEEAEAFLIDKSPDLILLDMRMPDVDGYELANRIKAMPNRAEIPVVAYTASVFSIDKILTSENFAGVLFKPVKRNELVSELKKHLQYSVQKVEESRNALEKRGRDAKLTEKLISEIDRDLLRAEFLPKWESVKDNLVLYKIEEFAHNLSKYAASNNLPEIENYAQSILVDVDEMNLDSLRERLSQFSVLT
jgi:signal transduction histidine kinase/CheY-like chemotaxis protein